MLSSIQLESCTYFLPPGRCGYFLAVSRCPQQVDYGTPQRRRTRRELRFLTRGKKGRHASCGEHRLLPCGCRFLRGFLLLHLSLPLALFHRLSLRVSPALFTLGSWTIFLVPFIPAVTTVGAECFRWRKYSCPFLK